MRAGCFTLIVFLLPFDRYNKYVSLLLGVMGWSVIGTFSGHIHLFLYYDTVLLYYSSKYKYEYVVRITNGDIVTCFYDPKLHILHQAMDVKLLKSLSISQPKLKAHV